MKRGRLDKMTEVRPLCLTLFDNLGLIVVDAAAARGSHVTQVLEVCALLREVGANGAGHKAQQTMK